MGINKRKNAPLETIVILADHGTAAAFATLAKLHDSECLSARHANAIVQYQQLPIVHHDKCVATTDVHELVHR